MRFLRRLLVLIFVRRKGQAHARAVLDARASERAKPDGADAVAAPAAVPAVAAPPSAVEVPTEDAPTGDAPVGEDPAEVPATVEILSPRDQLIREALAARKAHEAEWEALTPEQKKRAIIGLGEGMAAIVKTFRAA